MSEYTGSARRKLDRVIAAQRYDAEDFMGGRILGLVIPRRTPSGFSYKHAFMLDTTGRTREEAVAATCVPEAVVVYDEPFAAPPQEGPAKIAEREILVSGESDAARVVKDSVSTKLLFTETLPPPPPRYPGPFSVRTQLIAAGLAQPTETRFHGARVMALEGLRLTEEIYCLLAGNRAEAASAVRESFAERRDPGLIRSIEVEDTFFDRPYDANCPFIARRHSKLPMDDYLESLHLTARSV